MADETLRLPNSTFKAVFNLGDKIAARIPLPETLSEPDLFADYDDDEQMVTLYVGFDDGQIHLDVSNGAGMTHHYHDGSGEPSSSSPWSVVVDRVITEWAGALARSFLDRMPDLMDDIAEAAAWQEEGYPLYVCETDPAELDLIEVEIEGEILTLPWLGSGEVDDEHLDGDNHPIALIWTPERGTAKTIATAWIDQATSEPRTEAADGIDWETVGLPADEVLPWLESRYMNHHITPDAEIELLHAVLERMGGVVTESGEGAEGRADRR